MSEERKYFTFFWKIKNFSFTYTENNIRSPDFLVHEMNKTKWYLNIYPKSNVYEDCVACYFGRAHSDEGPTTYCLDFELAFLAKDGSVLHSAEYLQRQYENGKEDDACFIKRDELFFLKKDLFMPNDTLTMRCKMWNSREPHSQSGTCLGKTLVKTKCQTFVGAIKNFSKVEAGCEYLVINSRLSTAETFFSSVKLCVDTYGRLVLDVSPRDNKSKDIYKCQIFVRDIFGNKMKCGQGEYYDNKPHSISLFLLKGLLLENEELYLPYDVLSIEYKVIYPTNTIIHNEPEYEFGKVNFLEAIAKVEDTNLLHTGFHIENLKSLRDDWISIFREGILCDSKLKTATETFPAHAIVLSARSPVFKAMFATEMKEKISHSIDIDDLDADTVRRMLKFMYSATLDDLRYESAKNLYIAADKYDIVSLRQGCSNFFKQNILQSNCCDMLLLADKHLDEDLKSAIKDFISENDRVVLFSDEWKNLEKNFPLLTTEVLRFIYMKIHKYTRT